MADPTGRTGDPPVTPRLLLPVVLAMVAGYVDAIGFVWLFGVFSANQSGNVVLLGIALGGQLGNLGWPAVVSLLGFMAGAVAGTMLAVRLPGRPHGRVLVAIEVGLLVVMLATAGPLDLLPHPVPGVRGTVLLLLASVAMGVQTMALRRAAGVAVTTTSQSGATAHVAEWATRWLLLRTDRHQAARTTAVVAVVIGAYIAGAAAGSWIGDRWRWALVVPCLVMAAVLVAWSADAEVLADADAAD